MSGTRISPEGRRCPSLRLAVLAVPRTCLPQAAAGSGLPPHTQPGALPVKMPLLFAHCGICMALLFQQCLFFFPHVPDCCLASLFSP